MTSITAESQGQLDLFPKTRYMGSKTKLLQDIAVAAKQVDFDSVCDPFAGSGIVSYMFKTLGYSVRANDHMAMNSISANAMIENSSVRLSDDYIQEIREIPGARNGFIATTFKDLYFSDDDNAFLDSARNYIEGHSTGYEKSMAITALVRSCLKKRPRGIFTYTGNRYRDGRRDLSLGLREHFAEQARLINNSVFSNGKNSTSSRGDALTISPLERELIYLDPPYFSPHSDNDYVRRYHFVEGLALSWGGLELQDHTKTKKFKSYATPFSTRKGTYEAFELLFNKYRNNPMLISYSSNSLPTKDDLGSMLHNEGKTVEIVAVDHTYSFGTQKKVSSGQRNRVQEYIFIVE